MYNKRGPDKTVGSSLLYFCLTKMKGENIVKHYGDIYDPRWYRETEDAAYFALNPRYQEIIKLHDMLVEHDIPHLLKRVFRGWQVCYPATDDWILSAVEHDGSYGNFGDKIEIMGVFIPEDESWDDVVGYLTAEEVFKRIQEHYSQTAADKCITPSRILHKILSDSIRKPEDYTYIILGTQPCTGKSWLCKALRDHGLNAFEISEHIYDLVEYQDNLNYCRVDDEHKQVVIVLNKSLRN